LLCCFQDCLQYAVPISQLNVTFRIGVLAAVDFNNHAPFVTDKVYDKCANWRLPPEAQLTQAVRAQRRP